MKINTLGFLLVLALLSVGGWWYWSYNTTEIPVTGVSTTTPPVFSADQKLSFGTLSLAYSSADFGLATTEEQILVKSYIPSCDTDFNYCLYYHGVSYLGTNFESAGIRIQTRADLKTQTRCLTTPPDGYTNMRPVIATSTAFATSTFSPIGDAGAGHYASGVLYRLAVDGSCYEFETRIGEAQYANYPEGTVQKFTDKDQAAVAAMLMDVLKSVTIASSTKPF
jgi:hypothetical protein